MNEYLINQEEFLKVSTFLSAVRSKAQANGSNLLAGLKPADAKIVPNELFIHSAISGGGTQHLLNGETTQQKGVTNFDGNRLGQGRNFVIDSITLEYAEGDADVKLYDLDFTTTEIPPVLLSSNLIIRQNSDVIIKLPIRSIVNAKKTPSYYRELGAFALLVDQLEIEVSIELPSGSAIPTESNKKPYVGVYLKGFETYIKR